MDPSHVNNVPSVENTMLNISQKKVHMTAGARQTDLINGPVQTVFQPDKKRSTSPPALNKAVKTLVGDHHQSDKNQERTVGQDAGGGSTV